MLPLLEHDQEWSGPKGELEIMRGLCALPQVPVLTPGGLTSPHSP